MRSAKLCHVGASPEDVDYRSRRNLDKALFQKLLTGKWIRDRRNLLMVDGRIIVQSNHRFTPRCYVGNLRQTSCDKRVKQR